MIRVEIYAVPESRRFVVETEEEISCKRLAEGIRTVLSDPDDGVILCCDPMGMIPPEGCLKDYGIRSGALLLYVKEGKR